MMFNNKNGFDDDEELDSENFIPEQDEESTSEENDENDAAVVDIHDLLFSELTELLNNPDNKNNLALTSWLIGERLRRTLSVITNQETAILAFKALQTQIASRFGNEFSTEKLYSCLKLADDFSDITIFEEYSKFISLEHFLQIIKLESDMARTFYCEMTKFYKWPLPELQRNIDEKLYEKEFGE